MLWCRTACGYMWITRSPSTYPQKSRSRWRAGPRPASVAPMNDYEPLPGEPTATMFQSLEQIRRQTLQRCTATVGQSDRQLLFGMTTAGTARRAGALPLQSRHDRAACHGTDALRQASYSTVEIRPGHCPHLEPLHSAITHPHIEWRARWYAPIYGLPPKARYGWAFNATEYRMDDAMSWFLESPFVQEQPFRWTSHGSSSRSEWNMTAIIIERIRSSGAETTKKGNGCGPTAGY